MMFTLFVILLHVSRHAVAVVVQVYEEMEAVLLPCMYSGSIPEEDPTVIWSRYDLDPKIVHFRREEDDLQGQNQHYSGRTSMKPGALDIGDFSLTLTKPQLTDSGNYTCTISDGRQELTLKDIQLQVKVYQVEVKVEEGAESVILPCKTTAFLPEDITVEWIHSGPELKMVNFYRYGSSHNDKQDKLFCDRTKMNEDLLETGDLSLILKYPTKRDSGNYICTIYRSEDILRQKVVLQHFREQFPPWAKAVLVLLVLFLLVSGGLLFNFWHYFKSVYQVEVDSEREFVKLPCKTIIHLAEDSQIEWSNSKGWKIHMFENSSEQQHWFYRERTEMKKHLLKAGDLSLTLQYPTDSDTDTYTCAAYSSKGNILMKKHVQLNVKVCQIKVKDGEQSIELPFKSSCDLPDDIRVQWWRDEPKPVMMVHVYQNKSDEPEKQDEDYRGRTQMNENLLERGNLSLTLKHPKVRDTGRYRCRVDSRNIWREKTVLLEVKAAEQQIDPAGLEKGRLRRYSGSHEEEIALQSQTV